MWYPGKDPQTCGHQCHLDFPSSVSATIMRTIAGEWRKDTFQILAPHYFLISLSPEN